jgi:hypothetical protein
VGGKKILMGFKTLRGCREFFGVSGEFFGVSGEFFGVAGVFFWF